MQKEAFTLSRDEISCYQMVLKNKREKIIYNFVILLKVLENA